MRQRSYVLPSTLIRRSGVDDATAVDQFAALSPEQILKSSGSARNAGTKDTSAIGKAANGTIRENCNEISEVGTKNRDNERLTKYHQGWYYTNVES